MKIKLNYDVDIYYIYYYCIYNVHIDGVKFNDILYIGQTKNPIKRHKDHLTSSKSRCPVDKLLRSHKYSYGILWAGTEIDVDLREQSYIAQYHTVYPYGFNFETGGRSGANNRSISLATKEKKYNSPKNKPVLQYTLFGEFVKKWGSIRGACRELGFNEGDSASIVKSMNKNNKYLTAKGYIWREYDGKHMPTYTKTPYPIIVEVNAQGTILHKFLSIEDAARFYKVSSTTMKKIIEGKSNLIQSKWKLIYSLEEIQ